MGDIVQFMTNSLPVRVRACLFHLDGVLTDTATVHAAAGNEMFDAYLQSRAEPFVPFDPVTDLAELLDRT